VLGLVGLRWTAQQNALAFFQVLTEALGISGGISRYWAIVVTMDLTPNDRNSLPAADAYLSSLIAFLDSSSSPYHGIRCSIELLEAAGFVERTEKSMWEEAAGRWYVQRSGSLIAWAHSGQSPDTGFRLVGAHTDSPNLRLKPQQGLTSGQHAQVAVEVYGGILANTWLDRDLGVSGRLVLSDGSNVLVRINEPVCRISQLAIHLDPELPSKGLRLNPQQHLTPSWALGDSASVVEIVAESVGVAAPDILAHDLMLHDVVGATVGGANGEFLNSARIDNLVSCHAGIIALTNGPPEAADHIPILAMFDHEEVGSVSSAGAASNFLPSVLGRIISSAGGPDSGLGSQTAAIALAKSACISADGAHATHPNYADRHDPQHHIDLNGGPVLKHNANKRYATDATSAALFRTACDAAGVPMQEFVSRNDSPCGSTIGPTTAAKLGISTVDAGVAQLSMHSIREMCGTQDPHAFARALTKFYG